LEMLQLYSYYYYIIVIVIIITEIFKAWLVSRQVKMSRCLKAK